MDEQKLESLNIINALRRGPGPASGLEGVSGGFAVGEDGMVNQRV